MSFGDVQEMFENVCSKNTELSSPFRDEQILIESCKQMLSAKSWIKSERAVPVDEQLIIFENGKACMKNDKLDSALVLTVLIHLQRYDEDDRSYICFYRILLPKFVN